MLKNYILIAYRNALKNKTLSLINLIGLAIAFFCSLLLFLNTYHELSFDNFLADKERIFKLYHRHVGPEGLMESGAMGYPVAPTLKAEIPEIDAATRFMYANTDLEYNGKLINQSVNFVDADFLKVFSFEVVNGNKNNPLKDLGNVVLSERTAKRIFNNENPVGKTLKIKLRGEWKDMVVSAVVQDYPDNSSITYEVLLRPELRRHYEENKNDWNSQHHDVYVKLTKNSSAQSVENKLRNLVRKYCPGDTLQMKNQGYQRDENGDYTSLRLLPIRDVHFSKSLGAGHGSTSKNYIYTLLLISIFILAIACFNFINLNIARAFTRTKEVGVRKCLGANGKQIFTQLFSESFLICLFSVLIGLLLALVLFPQFNQLFGAHLKLSFFIRPSSITMLLLSMLLISLIAGGYPSLVVSKLSTSGILKGNFSIKKRSIFRNTLIVLQFGMACLLMICTLIAFQQLEYMRSMPLGFTKDAVISIPLHSGINGRKHLNRFRNELASHPGIKSITGSNINIGIGKDGSTSKQSSGFGYKDKSIFTNWITADYDFLKTLNIEPINGRDFSRNYGADTLGGVIVSESMWKQFGEKEAIGLTFSMDSTRPPYRIIGVIPDFHLYSLHEKKEPVTIDISQNVPLEYVFVKTDGTNNSAVMQKLKSIYKSLEPDKEFEGTFMDENTNNWYNKEKSLSVLLGTSSIVAIVISCLGLFALALLLIQQRTKEIGVRKVLGASVFNINLLLSLEFVKLVVMAVLISVGPSLYLMKQWLQQFPYKTELHWLVFIGVGITAVVLALITIGYHTIKAAHANPVKNLRTE